MNKNHILISRYNQACYTELNDEIVVLNPIDENVYHFNKTAADLWKSLDTPKTLLQLCEILVQKYNGTLEHYQSYLSEWVENTQQKGLLMVMNDADVTTNV